MRRAPIVITATVLGTAGVLLFKPLSTTAAASAPGATDQPPSTAPASAEPSASASASSSSSSSTSTSTSTGTSGRSGSFIGTAETTRFGTTQVKVTIASGRITRVTTLSINENDPRSTQISEQAIPTLRSEVLSKQTAAVDTVSGATYTSAAYEASLQSALDKADYTAPDGTKASMDLSNLEQGGSGH